MLAFAGCEAHPRLRRRRPVRESPNCGRRPLAEHAGPERRQAAPPARASEELATAAPHGQALNARAEARLGPAAQLLNGARAGAASAAQRTVIPEGEFAKKGKMADALRLLIAAIATDEVAGALYRDAEKDGSDL